jgi:hypothetical protein
MVALSNQDDHAAAEDDGHQNGLDRGARIARRYGRHGRTDITSGGDGQQTRGHVGQQEHAGQNPEQQTLPQHSRLRIRQLTY